MASQPFSLPPGLTLLGDPQLPGPETEGTLHKVQAGGSEEPRLGGGQHGGVFSPFCPPLSHTHTLEGRRIQMGVHKEGRPSGRCAGCPHMFPRPPEDSTHRQVAGPSVPYSDTPGERATEAVRRGPHLSGAPLPWLDRGAGATGRTEVLLSCLAPGPV